MRLLLLCLLVTICGPPWDGDHAARNVTPTPYRPTTATINMTAITDIAFLDAQTGWVVGTTCVATPAPARCALALRHTHDGGTTWTPLPRPPIDPNQARHLHFMSRTVGWLYGPGMYVTRDGGQTWTTTTRIISALVSVGASIWAIEQRPGAISRPVTGALDLPDMHSALIQSTDGGQTWHDAPTQPPEISAFSQLLRTSAQQAWVVAPTEIGPWIQTTTDGGRIWTQIPNFMNHMTCGLAAKDIAGRDQLWFLCAGAGATDMQSKRLYTSPDEGQYWTIPADNMFFQPPVGTLPSVGSFSDPAQLVALSAKRAFLGLGGSTLFVTNDGGHTWHEAIPSTHVDPASTGGIRSVSFADATHGWALTNGRVFFRTSDGGRTWQTIHLGIPTK